MVSRADGSFPVVLIREVVSPRAIAVHPIRRFLFWSQASYTSIESNKLMRSYLDGSNQTAISDSSSSPRISSIAIDFSQERLYWCDNSRRLIISSNLDGKHTITVHSSDTNMFALTIMNDYLLYSDVSYYNEGVHAIDKMTGAWIGAYRPSHDDYHSVYDLTFHHISNQPTDVGPCSFNNGGCDQICLPNHFGFRCVCSFGYFSTGNKTCETVAMDSWLLLVADQRYRAIFQIQAGYFEYYMVPLQQLKQPHGITYDKLTQMVYWSDVQLGTISRAFLNGSHQHVIFGDRRHQITHIAIESELRLLYYVDAARGNLGVIWLKNETYWVFNTLIRNELNRPFGLSIDSAKGYLYVTEGGYFPSILRAKMDGSDVREIIKHHIPGVYNPRGVTTNEEGTMIYWVDAIQNIIHERNLTSNNTRRVLGDSHSQTGSDSDIQWYVISDVAVSDKKIYWADMETGNVFRATLPGCQDVKVLGYKNMLFRPSGIIVERETKLIDHENGLRGYWIQALWQKTYKRPASSCANNNGGCDNACLPTPGMPTCLDDFSIPSPDAKVFKGNSSTWPPYGPQFLRRETENDGTYGHLSIS
ncbi:hypothetical protein ScPMuIL_003116 [Solemya velum]